MKIILALILLFVVQFFEIGRAEALCYQMASYSKDGRAAPQTPLFDLRIFNGTQPGCFPIVTREGTGGSGGVDQTGFTSYRNGIQFLFDLMIGASIALAVLLFTVGAAQGIFYTVSSTELTAGRKRMKDALVGLLVVLSMWLVINTVNRDLLNLPALRDLYWLNPARTSPDQNSGVVGRPGA